MQFTVVLLIDFLVLWFLPFYLAWTWWGLLTALFGAAPIIALLSIGYARRWKPSNWLWVRGNPKAHTWLYDSALEVHGPGAKFAPASDRKYVVGAHPHGLYPVGITKHFTLNPNFMTFRTCVHWMLTTFPIFKELTGWAGCIDATRESMSAALEQDDVQGLVVCPGSVREGVIEPPGTVVQRTGFISIAQKHKAYLVPVYDATVASLWDIWLPLGTYFHSMLRYPWLVLAKGRSPSYLSPFPKAGTVHLYIGEPIPTEGRELGDLLGEFYDRLKDLKELARQDGNLLCDSEWK